MSRDKIPVTPALLTLKKNSVVYTPRTYKYVERGGTRVSAMALGVDEHEVIKTLVMEDEQKTPLIILMHGDREVSTKNLARFLGVKAVHPCDPKIAEKHTGYKVGGTSPFGTKKTLPIYMEETIAELPRILINAGSRGFLAEMPPSELIRVLHPIPVKISVGS
ncbi:Cys-tRNA(Pro) deacylase [Syntrophus gentianae]|uniref:Cys-tRNA(Pro)/Cys-tRNA(Cys) deacylase n=1 Tax=Syntrophus gentianae TaxID=43775 RepID=A0A1H7VXW0_9BACT|nr:aminoacyl-tRNA deacylase [Syntrophus gentianae]SEM14071.1 Cys-tRNA(Pro) deacylase [Syntrophus gentianae]